MAATQSTVRGVTTDSRSAKTPFQTLSHQRSQILVADRLGNVAAFIEHLDFSATIAGALPCVTERRFARVFVAVNRANALRLENFPAAVFLPAVIA